MQTPLEIEFRHLDRSEAVEKNIEDHVRKLEECFSRITRCRPASLTVRVGSVNHNSSAHPITRPFCGPSVAIRLQVSLCRFR